MKHMVCYALILSALITSACTPEPGTAEYDAYIQHKANRAAVQYQGF
ncbi:MAG: hypothetical protein AB3N11_16310 [Arenibacterium sp.]